jgi:hypothetical protein
MTVRVTQKMRKRIDAMKKEKELVTDDSYKDIHKRGFIYESPDAGKTIYRRPSSYCDVSGVKIDEFDQLQFNFNNVEDEVNEQVEKNPDDQISKRIILAKISQVATLIGEITEEIKDLKL